MEDAAERRERLEAMRKRAREVRERQEQEDKELQDEAGRKHSAPPVQGGGEEQGGQGMEGLPGTPGMQGHAGIPPVGRFLQTNAMGMPMPHAGDGSTPGYYASFHLPSGGMNGNFEVQAFSAMDSHAGYGDVAGSLAPWW
ncbi:hypothetical protein GUITHDRAFT_107387 [Guillardia theta CCMP2712]|uniref:Uncharacterized protein n=1 Tax=Guillardia theta (strain CCMP2712) TaxID=905079 RepID=L1JE54_GUITC|nr:hypothetical protein GUITHDRAFT_107387 [Guillardia theta CCMP2712]EKX46602.1 hypothetical protein GUITHDRAFT_107387 [Guillardia theta CCMP2712]|eukprot:XP_005833582.1 hypothetical protein GUITHDRAFT_107387 [Guillardia theta CCMP2712]